MGSRLEKNSAAVRKRIESHNFNDEDGEEYEGSKFGGFSDYMRRKKIKLQNLDAEIRNQASGKPPIFKGIVAHVNGYTQPSLNDLHGLIVSHGGGFLQYLDGKTAVTHVIASNLTPKKKVEFARYRIVKPAWVVDSVKQGRLLAWDAYRVVDEGVTQKVLGFDGGTIVSQAGTQRQGYKEQTETSWYTSQLRNQPNANELPDQNSNPISDGIFEQEETRDGLSHAPLDDDMELEPLEEPDEDAELMGPAPSGVKAGTAQDVDVPNANKTVQSMVRTDMAGDIPTERKTSPVKKLTAEQHNAILLQNPHMAKSSTANPDFINQYYRESRLHHLSTWKAELKAQLQARAQEKSSSQNLKQKRPPGSRRYILHVDFDSFFAAVSLRKNQHLVYKPVVIAHGSGPGSEIASCNYPARKYGVKNGMWMKTALGLCPEINVLPYDFKLYEEASRHFYDSILAVEGVVQSISIDEALVDISEQCIRAGGSDGKAVTENSIYREQEKASQVASEVRNAVKEKTGCDVSVGVGANILLAKAALRKAKPAGQYLIKPEEVLDFLGELQVTSLPGIAWSIGTKLEEIGVKFVKDIRGLTKERLMAHLGPKTGEKIWDYSRGIDKQEVGEQVVRKSVSAEINWGIRFIDQQQAEDFVQSLCNEVSKRLLEQLVKGRQLTMKIMRKSADAGMDPPKNLGHGKCDTFNKSIVLGVGTTDPAVIGKEAISVLRSYGFPPGELRGLGVQMQKLEPLKPAATNSTPSVDASQRRLQFKRPSANPGADLTLTAATPKKLHGKPTNYADSIEEVASLKKQRTVGGVRSALPQGETGADGASKPLNIGGTQFLLPTQIDPSVLEELPTDVRSKLATKQKSVLGTFARSISPHAMTKSRSASPHVSDGEYTLPNQSQLDPQTLAELPEDVRDELLQHYKKSNKKDARLQQVLPQSPRKSKPVMQSEKLVITPTKKQKFSNVLGKGKITSNKHAVSTLTQSNFVSMPKASHDRAQDEAVMDTEISQSFLEELPEDIRLEVLAEQKRQRMKIKSGLNLAQSRKRPKAPVTLDIDALRGQQRLKLPAQPPRPTFTSRKLSTLPDLRDAMTAWVREFSDEDEEGPYEEDREALAIYLRRVVTEEGDVDKAVAVLQWLDHVIDMQTFRSKMLHTSWESAVDFLRSQVQEVVKERGLPPVRFV